MVGIFLKRNRLYWHDERVPIQLAGQMNPYVDLMRRATRQQVPFAAMLELTYRCNLDCWFCYNDRASVKRALNGQQWIDVLEQSARMGVLHLALTGGEPTLHPEFFDILEAARRLGFVIRIKTNGHTLGRRMAKRIKQVGDPFSIDISIHGADAETHETQTQVPGSFNRLLRNVATARQEGLRIKLACALTKWNEESYEAIFEIAKNLDAGIRFNPDLSPRDDGGTDPFELKMSATAYRGYKAWLARHSGEVEEGDDDLGAPEQTCGAGGNGFTIDPAGNVLACIQWRAPAGNLLERPLAKIWQESAQLQHAREVTREAVQHLGPGETQCSFCPGMAFVVSGDPLADYRHLNHPLGAETAVSAKAAQQTACGCSGALSES